MAGNQALYGAKEIESGFSAVSLRPCGPLALIPINVEKIKLDMGPMDLETKRQVDRLRS
jgi:hypothetical protein